MIAAEYNQFACVELLLGAGADINIFTHVRLLSFNSQYGM
jgi:hypothetical protein